MSQTHLCTFGHGPRAALAIHCTLAHSGAWRGLGAAQQQHLTLHAIDLPGHGKSEGWDRARDLHDQCLDAVLQHLTQPMDVIGHSFGATIALRLAVEHPHLVRSLTLIEPVFFTAAIADALNRMVAHDIEAAPCFAALERGDTHLAARLFNRLWGDGTRWGDMPPTTRRYLEGRIHIVTGQATAIIEDRAGLMAAGALDRAAMPTLLIEGEQRLDIIDAINASLAKRLPDARRASIAGAGHKSVITHPRAIADEIIKLLEMTEEEIDLRRTQ